jgi:hypothetical protein|tara:strand:- start:264 stop:635 length:372 start_codon:yes stop_codon:yes gene_type:complete
MHKWFNNEWRIDSLNRVFVGNIIELAEQAPLVPIKFSDICRFDMYEVATKKRQCCLCCNGVGMFYADISKPGIVLRADNPAKLPYRLLDGRHRIWAMEAQGMTEAKFKVIELAQIKPYLKITP